MTENACIKCHEHNNRDAVGTCALCGRGFCDLCRSAVEGRVACSTCAAKWFNIPIGDIKSEFKKGPVTVKSHDGVSRSAVGVLLLLSSITYIPLLAYWDKGSSTYVVLLVLAIISFGFQIALIVRNNIVIWCGCFLLWIVDMIVTTAVQLYYMDPTGALPLVILLFFSPFGIGILVWISYRSEKLMWRSMAITAVLSVVIWGILQSTLVHW